MKKLAIGIGVLMLLAIVLPGLASADDEFKINSPKVTILSSDEDGTTMRIDFSGFYHTITQEGDRQFDILEIPGCGKILDVGKPALPVYGTLVPIPEGKYFNYASVLDSTLTSYKGYKVYPAQEPADDAVIQYYPPFPTPTFTIDEAFYETAQTYPLQIVLTEPVGKVRDNQVLPLRVFPFQHNPVTGELIYYSSITIRIGYTSGPIIIESALVKENTALQDNGNTGCDFLIITDPSLLGAANTLAARRNSQGLTTLVVDTGTTGTTADNIKSYIQTAYDTWNPRPSYLLLLGDANFIPPFYRTVHTAAGTHYESNSKTGTDLYYAIMNGPEAGPPYYSEYWTPDLFIGRIPVDTLDEANTEIGKIIEYEDHQWVSGENAATVAGYFQDDDLNGYEDRRFILTSEEIRDFLVGEGFIVDRLYTTPATVTPTNYNNGDYDAGAALPSNLLRPTLPWDADTTDITNAINAGRFIVFHRDHGGSKNRASSPVEGWGDPQFEASDVASLTNNGFYTIVYSMNCETGWFDGETDDNAARNFDSLCEAFIRRVGGGAVGAVGATRISQSGWNDDLSRGFIDAIWPAFDTSHGGLQPIMRMGEVLNYGKEYMIQFRSTGNVYTKQTYELFHYFGDPTMALKIPVENTPPTADPNGPYIVDEKTPVIFDGSGSSDPDAGDSIVSYEWDLNGDGIFETTGVSPSYTWCDDYTGTVTLKVTDTRGASSTASTTVTVNNVAPTVTMASLDQPNPQFILPGQLLTFHGSFIDPGCDTWTYAWSFGDGTSSVAGSLTVILPLTVSHSYTVPGEYPVVLKVTDDNGGSGSSTLTVHVADVVEAKHDLNNYIQNLPDSAFKGNPAQRKNALDNMFRALDTKLENKAYQGFIQDITNNIRGKADGLVDGKSGDDWITDKVAQQHICQKIDDIVKYVKTIK